MCPTTNQLALTGVGPDNKLGTPDDTGFRYYAVNGAYSTKSIFGPGYVGPTSDAEGYKGLEYGNSFSTTLYNHAEILPAQKVGPYYTANTLAPGAELALTFKLMLPEPCNGDFDTGSIYFWGEAI
jgi:hypothetical protein